MSNDKLTLRTIEALHSCVAMANPSPAQVDDLLLELGKEIDRAKVNDTPTLLLERLYEEVMWLKTEINNE